MFAALQVILTEPQIRWMGHEGTMYIWAFAVFIADKSFEVYSTGWIRLRSVQHVLFFFALLVRFSGGLAHDMKAVTAAWYLLSLAIIISCLRMMELFSVQRALGACAYALNLCNLCLLACLLACWKWLSAPCVPLQVHSR